MPAGIIAAEIDGYRRLKAEERARAGQRVALLALCGVDLDVAAGLRGEARAALCRRLEIKIERERLKGAARPWNYDLNRHIALKQALDALRGAP
ncbi:MAG: cytoplasmic protein [Phyllobacteriaceae bacterium]|nr:cytoplasmic protein [Phyllobacteriaceae bacterium]